jgi:AcrR family transcriptional regulator
LVTKPFAQANFLLLGSLCRVLSFLVVSFAYEQGQYIKITLEKLISISFVQNQSMAKIKPGKNASKKDVIAQKAAILFRSRGFSSTSMRELADAVGVEAPSLYNHIGSKSELLQGICFKIANAFTIYLDTTENSPGNYITRLEQIIRFHIRMMLDNFDEVYVANHEWKHLKEPYLSNFLMQRRGYEKRLIGLMEGGILAKEFKSTNPYVAVLTILSAVRGLEFWQQHKKNIGNQVLEDDMVAHLLKGIIK